jgi:hypothetical protein
MKALKYFIGAFLLIATVWSCTEEEIGNLDFVNSAVAPTNVNALFNVTQDNTGLVTITPNADGAKSFDIYFGDETTEPAKAVPGQNITHTYNEGTYKVKLVAYGITGLLTEVEKDLVVSFKAPENLVVTISNDEAISKQVNVTATADFGVSFEVYFGEEGVTDPVIANIGETASYVYQEVGIYNIKVIAKSAAIQTVEYNEDFEVTAILQPVAAAPTPTDAAKNVISIYSDAYTNVALSELNPNWGQTTTLTEIQIDGNNTWVYNNLNYTGIVTDYGNPTDLSEMEYVHFDYWTPDGTSLGLKLVNTSYGDGDPLKEDIENVGTMTQGEWVSVNIPLADFTTDVSGVTQLLFDTLGASATIFIDNFYFWKESTIATAPNYPASSPTYASANVISIFSNAYTSVGISELNPNWGQSTSLTNVNIEGDDIWLYESLNFTGIVTDYGNPTNLSGMDYLHFDYFTPDAEALGFKMVNTNVGEEDIEFLGTIVKGTWVSVTIPLDNYAIDRSAVSQLLFDTNGFSAKVYIDNLYFYTEDDTTQPTVVAPVPTIPSSDVISIFSDSYTSVGISELNPNWGQTTTLTSVDILGNNIWMYETLNYTGIVTDYDNPTNLAGASYVHFDYFTPDATALGLKIVNTVVGQEDIKFVDVVNGTWVSVTIPLDDYAIDRSGITQLLFDTSGASATVYIDNLYFY